MNGAWKGGSEKYVTVDGPGERTGKTKEFFQSSRTLKEVNGGEGSIIHT